MEERKVGCETMRDAKYFSLAVHNRKDLLNRLIHNSKVKGCGILT